MCLKKFLEKNDKKLLSQGLVLTFNECGCLVECYQTSFILMDYFISSSIKESCCYWLQFNKFRAVLNIPLQFTLFKLKIEALQ